MDDTTAEDTTRAAVAKKNTARAAATQEPPRESGRERNRQLELQRGGREGTPRQV